MTDVLSLAKRQAETEAHLQLLGQANAYGRTPEEQATVSARYLLAQDAHARAVSDYRAAINGMSAEELIALAKRPKSEGKAQMTPYGKQCLEAIPIADAVKGMADRSSRERIALQHAIMVDGHFTGWVARCC